jgi:hypothetical protein
MVNVVKETLDVQIYHQLYHQHLWRTMPTASNADLPDM